MLVKVLIKVLIATFVAIHCRYWLAHVVTVGAFTKSASSEHLGQNLLTQIHHFHIMGDRCFSLLCKSKSQPPHMHHTVL